MRVVLCTCPPDRAVQIAQTLVGERLAACVNIVPGLASVYWWKDAIQNDSESLLVMKTTGEAVERLKKRLVEIHPYSVPEFLALAVAEGHEPYVEWVSTQTR